MSEDETVRLLKEIRTTVVVLVVAATGISCEIGALCVWLAFKF